MALASLRPVAPLRRFIAVGSVAAGVHLAVVVLLVRQFGAAPLWANLAGWAVAACVSFGGHLRWTFRAAGAPLRRSAARFLALSALGFAVNEATYAGALRWTGLPFHAALAVVLMAVAGLTYLLSRHWAFQGRPPTP